MLSTFTPRSSQAYMTRLIARTPARWPKLTLLPWSFAQRPLPSMMIPTWCGIPRELFSTRGAGRSSDLHHLGFFRPRDVLDAADVGVGDLLQALQRPFCLVLGDLALLLHPLHPVDLVAADVADRDARLLGFLPDHLHVVPPALLGEGRDGNP